MEKIVTTNPGFVKKVVIIGPESTGKSTLTQQLAQHFNAPMVKEYARQYLEQLDRPYQQQDLVRIAKGQIAAEELATQHLEILPEWLFCDTDLRVIKIWSQVKFGKVDPWIMEQITLKRYHCYLLTATDLPWEPDAQREHPQQRSELFARYLDELESSKVPFYIVKGKGKLRLQSALNILAGLNS